MKTLVLPTKNSSYCEISQSSKTKFSGVIRDGDKFVECFTPAKCRDYLPDTFTWRYILNKANHPEDLQHMGIYGFAVSMSSPAWDFSPDGHVYMKIQSSNIKEIEAIEKMLPDMVSWLKYHSPFLGKNVSVALKGTVTQEEYVASGRTHWDLYTNHEGGSAVHYLVLKMHKNHFFNAPAVSLMTLLLRACAWNWHYNADTFEGLRKGIIEGVYSHNEKSYFQRIFSTSYNWKLFFKYFHKIASTVSNLLTLELNYTSVGSETKEYLDRYYTNTYTIADTMHNYSGIIAAVTACQTCWDLQVKGTNADNVSNILIAANYQRIVKEQLKKDNALVIPAKFKKDGEIQWEKVKKADLWGTVLAKYVGAVMP